jgi:hypothetical protein
MLLSAVFQRFVARSPIRVMARGTLEYPLSAPDLGRVFANTADRQYTRSLLLPAVTELMSAVVRRIRPSARAAYPADPDRLGVSPRAVYDTLSGPEPGVTEAVVAHTAATLAPVIRRRSGRRPRRLPGHRVRILGGNHLAATDRRLAVLREHAAGPRPGRARVVYDPDAGRVTAMVGCGDGHARERAARPAVPALVRPREVWVADRNVCTTAVLFGPVLQRATFVIRQRRPTPHWELSGRRRAAGRCDGGRVGAPSVAFRDEHGRRFVGRRVTVASDTPTRDGGTEAHILTDLPSAVASAARVAGLDRRRWAIGTAFAGVEKTSSGVIRTPGDPPAAVFALGPALAAANVRAAVQAAVQAVHPDAADTVSGYDLADELAGTYRGVMIAIPAEAWAVLGPLDERDMARPLRGIAGPVRVSRYRKHPRRPKTPPAPRRRDRGRPHVATARRLAGRETNVK